MSAHADMPRRNLYLDAQPPTDQQRASITRLLKRNARDDGERDMLAAMILGDEPGSQLPAP